MYYLMEREFAGLIVLHPAFGDLPAFKKMVDGNGWLHCSVVDTNGPIYLRVKLTEEYQSRKETEILIPHCAVALIMVDENVKSIGFQ